MPAIIRKSYTNIFESRREILHTISWQVRSTVWRPPTDVYETDESLVIKVEIAGMRDEDFEVTLADDLVKIAGIRPDVGGRRAYHQLEIFSGRFEIEVEVALPVDIESSTAEYKDGFLTINLSKAQPKQIRVEE